MANGVEDDELIANLQSVLGLSNDRLDYFYDTVLPDLDYEVLGINCLHFS